jgi:hypothetical protein
MPDIYGGPPDFRGNFDRTGWLEKGLKAGVLLGVIKRTERNIQRLALGISIERTHRAGSLDDQLVMRFLDLKITDCVPIKINEPLEARGG